MTNIFMRKFKKISLLLFAILATASLVGCSKPRAWIKDGITQEEFDKDFARCTREASSPTQIFDNANGIRFDQGLERDVTRDNFIKKCMFSVGYKIKDK
jgi:hypothetical protein